MTGYQLRPLQRKNGGGFRLLQPGLPESQIIDNFAARFPVKPGMTGLAKLVKK